MAQSFGDRNYTSSEDYLCTAQLDGIRQNIFLSALNIIISITAILGNLLIIAALPKVSSLHSSSKLLFRCLACTDLCVGIILQPLNISYLISPEDTKLCYYLEIISNVAAVIFCGVSMQTLTAISVDRLLALLLGLRYR